jgi:hypothetical protein
MRFLAKNKDWKNADQTLPIIGSVTLTVFFILFHDIEPEIPVFVKNRAKSPNFLGPISQKEFLRTSIFLGLMLLLCLTSFIGTDITVSICDIFRTNGIDRRVAIKKYRYRGYCIAFAGLLFGHQIDKNRIKACILLLLFSQLFGLIGLEISRNIFGLGMYIVSMAHFCGGYGILRQVVWSKYLKRKTLAPFFAWPIVVP